MLSEQNKKQIIENLTQGIKYHQDALDIIKTNQEYSLTMLIRDLNNSSNQLLMLRCAIPKF